MSVEDVLDPSHLRDRMAHHLTSAETWTAEAGKVAGDNWQPRMSAYAARAAAHAALAEAYASAYRSASCDDEFRVDHDVIDSLAEEFKSWAREGRIPATMDDEGWVYVGLSIMPIPVGAKVEYQPATGRVRPLA
jgi:hypothetical protein